MFVKSYDLTRENVTLTAYILDQSPEMAYHSKRPAMLVCPGGGYHFCSDREAEPIAMRFLSMGFNTFVLRYSLKEKSVWPTPLNDADEAMQFIVDNAEEFKIIPEKIAVCGFSAGGHLAASLGVLGKIRPAAMVLGYPCITEDICNSEVLANPVPELDTKVDDLTPPAFIYSTADDGCVPIRSSLDFCSALSRKNIPFELHIFPHGNHGLSTSDYVTCDNMGNDDVANWIPLCKSFLKNLFFN